MFGDILVPIDGKSERWFALEQAVIIAKKENARLFGLHVTVESLTQDYAAMAGRFSEYCQSNGVEGSLNFIEGDTAKVISHQAAWLDLITMNLAYRPGDSPLSRLTHGFRVIMQRTPRPVLAVPQAVSDLKHALLAYDHSSGAREALYVATYIAGRWGTRLSILTVHEKDRKKASNMGAEALRYVQEHNLSANMITSALPVNQGILKTARDVGADLIIMGGFSRPPLLGILLDTIMDRVLRESQIPMLMCR